MIAKLKKGNKIYIKPSKRGSFTSWCGGKVTNECIRRGKNSSSSAIRKKATFAQNARRWSKHQQGGLVKAQLGTKFMDWIKNIVQAGAINENPSVMTASGWRYNSNGKVKQDTQNKEDVKQLRNNLSSLGEGALAAITASGDLEGLYNIARHPKQTFDAVKLAAKEIPIEVHNMSNMWKNWVDYMHPKTNPNRITSVDKLKEIGEASRNKAFEYYKSNEFIRRAKNAGFKDDEIIKLQKELEDMLSHSQVKVNSNLNNGIHAQATAYLDKNGNLYRNATAFNPEVQGFSLEDLISMWDHEFGHVATNTYNTVGRNLGNYMSQVEKRYPMIVKMMKYNESISPKLKPQLETLYNYWHNPDIKANLKKSYPKMTNDEINELVSKYQKFSETLKDYIGNSNETRSRALATQFAAQRKGKSAYQYTQENQDELNAARELDNIFEENSLKKYLDNFMSYGIPTITIGGTSYVGATNSSKNK